MLIFLFSLPVTMAVFGVEIGRSTVQVGVELDD